MLDVVDDEEREWPPETPEERGGRLTRELGLWAQAATAGIAWRTP